VEEKVYSWGKVQFFHPQLKSWKLPAGFCSSPAQNLSQEHFLPQVLAQNLQKIDPKSDGAKRDWVAIYDECANLLYQVGTGTTFLSRRTTLVCMLTKNLMHTQP
jgi:hypothetical protein